MGKLNRPDIKRPKFNRPNPDNIKKPQIDKSDPDWYWHLIQGGKENCCICNKQLKGRPYRFIGYHKLSGEELRRHEYCEPGSSRYIEKFGGYICENLKNVKPPEKEKSYVNTFTVGTERSGKNKKIKLKLKRKT